MSEYRNITATEVFLRRVLAKTLLPEDSTHFSRFEKTVENLIEFYQEMHPSDRNNISKGKSKMTKKEYLKECSDSLSSLYDQGFAAGVASVLEVTQDPEQIKFVVEESVKDVLSKMGFGKVPDEIIMRQPTNDEFLKRHATEEEYLKLIGREKVT